MTGKVGSLPAGITGTGSSFHDRIKGREGVLEDGEAKVIPEETGTKLDTAKLYDKVINALKNYDTTLDVEAEECYIPAHILADSESILKTKEDADAFCRYRSRV